MHDESLLGTTTAGEAKRPPSTPVPGEVFTLPYPFIRDTYGGWEGDGEGGEYVEQPTWKPGTRYENAGGPDGGSVDTLADAMGSMVLTVVSVHKPGTFPARVFFLREWIAPDGHKFGKRKLRITSLSNFRSLSRGFRHRFEMAEQVQEARSA